MAAYPDRVKSLSLHSAWAKSDAALKTAAEGWQVMAKAMNSVPEMVIQGIFPWCFTPELYAPKPDYIQTLSDFVRGRPKQPRDDFIRQSDAVLAHDAEAQLGKIRAPTQITFGRRDMVTSARFSDRLKNGIENSELYIFEDCAHAPLYENVPAFNERDARISRKECGLKRRRVWVGQEGRDLRGGCAPRTAFTTGQTIHVNGGAYLSG